MPVRALLFDVDGTLVDSNGHHVEAWHRAFAAAGHDFDRQRLHDQIGKGGDNFVPALLPNAPDDEQQALKQRHSAIFKSEMLDQVRPFDGARDLIARAAERGQKVVLASSAKEQELDHYVELLGVGAMLAATTSSDEVESSKPAPDIFAAALKKLPDIAPDEALVIGDTPYDIAAAAKCGIAAVAVRSGGFSDEALAGAVAIYDDVAALLADYDRSPLRPD